MIHHTRAKKAYHADPEYAEWTTQEDPTDPQGTKIILKKKKKTRPRTSPLQDKGYRVKAPAAQPHQRNSEPDQCSCTGQRLQLVGTFLRELPQLLQLLGMWGHTPVSNGRTPLVGIATPLWGLYTTVLLLRATERNFSLSHQP